MSTNYSTRYAVHEEHYRGMDTQTLRDHFLVSNLFVKDEINLTYTHYERFIVGGAHPVSKPIKLEAIDALKSATFLARRELGIINVGGAGTVVVDGETYELAFKEALYIGAGANEVVFHSSSAQQPAKYYLNSAPAHKSFPIKKICLADADKVELGSSATANERVINKLMVNSVLETCQLQMGMTELLNGSVWNTMPAHVHDRRIEVYFYFNLPEDQAVCHFMGPPTETRHLWLKNDEAVVSPPWSMHSGVGTASYIFIWSMAGENMDYDDMDKFTPKDMR